ncbi:cobaltochelatase subunit CobN [Albimonas sp. CAU 1670]|uniref:cobaltochelatase subunit CobN n=1 Tax=Albimonas sp. CAU 1670 TaxID=3032599 RepID=UPI0023DBD5D1|nr:cobaltochelatase subunit CobN [Albimonas sp. CAU 1670]MDF2234204.1 cobaltochelatase subunit CobN [Albimonas sp. CAU 1670]
MHLLAATPGEISDGTEPVDPAQDPADLVFVSAADTELAALSEARRGLGEGAPSLRLAHLNWLAHPYSVDLYLDRTATKSRMVVARVLGGAAYWRYGLEQFAARLHAAGVPFAALPGDDKPDETLARLSTVSAEDYAALWSFCVEGGPDNARGFLSHARAMLDGTERPEAARPLLRAGLIGAPRAAWRAGAPVAAVTVYRALVQGAGLAPVEALCAALAERGLNPLPIFVASLKDPVSAATVEAIFAETPPDVVINCTSFAVGSPDAPGAGTVLDRSGAPVLQAVLSAGSEAAWAEAARGLSARDIAMNVALPEIDGRILTRAIAFKGEAWFDEATQCPIAAFRPKADRIDFVASLAANWARLRRAAPSERRVGIVLANYPNKDGRLANGVGLDTPAGTVAALAALKTAGYAVESPPESAAALMEAILAGPTNWLTDRAERRGGERLSLAAYREAYARLPEAARRSVEERWGPPEADPFCDGEGFALSILRYGNAVVGVQPARGYNIDPDETYHAPDLAPPHNYLAFYIWLREAFGAHALVHFGKHGNLEWLPGKAVALAEEDFPEAVLGPLPHLYPFIVNDPGEGTQAKRRTQAVIVDHLTPPLTRAESYGDLRALEALVDEYYEAAGVDPRRIDHLKGEILSLMSATGLDVDVGAEGDDADSRLQKLDAYLCELKESQIRDGLHVFGESPQGRLRRDLAIALARVPRGDGKGADASLIRALAVDLAMDFDPLDCPMAERWTGPRPAALTALTDDPWRTQGDAVERLELLAIALLEGEAQAPGSASAEVMAHVRDHILPTLDGCGPAEMGALLTGLSGRFVPPGPSGAPTRGRLDVLPTGRNFFSVDSRAVPTRAAWALGWRSASELIDRHVQEQGDWPRTMAVTAWGTANMRTGGDDIAQALALMGVRPQWDDASRRVTGFEIIPASALGRPRVDVTLRVSGFFRDAFPAQVDLVASAAAAVMRLDEQESENPAAGRFRREATEIGETRALRRVFGSKPGAYGAGLQAMIDEKLWTNRADLADAYLEWGGYAYGAGEEGASARADLETRLSLVEATVQNQDNREHDLLDSDDYYQFEGGIAAAVETLRGQAPISYHTDHSRPERPVIRTLDEEIGRVVRARAVNPKWIEGVKRHGYKGAFEIAATVDYLFAFAATTHAVRDHHFDLVHAAYLEDDDTRAFIEDANPAALREIAERLQEAIDRDLWRPRSNSARALLDALTDRSPA